MLSKLRLKAVEMAVGINEKYVFENRLRKFYKRELVDDLNVVIDVGVNHGQTIDFFTTINRNISFYGIEPNPSLFTELSLKYQSNSLVNLFQIGISNENGTKKFYENILDATSTFEKLNTESDYLMKKARILGVEKNDLIRNQYDVRVVKLSDFIFENINEKKIDVLKIDTEGHEYSCLLGLFDNEDSIHERIKYIQIENHNDDMYVNKIPTAQIESLLNENGFQICGKVKHGFGDIDELIFKNII